MLVFVLDFELDYDIGFFFCESSEIEKFLFLWCLCNFNVIYWVEIYSIVLINKLKLIVRELGWKFNWSEVNWSES